MVVGVRGSGWVKQRWEWLYFGDHPSSLTWSFWENVSKSHNQSQVEGVLPESWESKIKRTQRDSKRQKGEEGMREREGERDAEGETWNWNLEVVHFCDLLAFVLPYCHDSLEDVTAGGTDGFSGWKPEMLSWKLKIWQSSKKFFGEQLPPQ